jgi:endonuclease YncB( thermonuclease family)
VYQYRIEHVKKIRHGDTFELIMDLGFQVSTTVSVRLEHAETPEFGSFDRFGKDEGDEARRFTVTWFQENVGPFILHTTRDRRGDYLGTVYDANGNSLANDLITKGLGRAYQ